MTNKETPIGDRALVLSMWIEEELGIDYGRDVVSRCAKLGIDYGYVGIYPEVEDMRGIPKMEMSLDEQT
jgi:hypothetical protein